MRPLVVLSNRLPVSLDRDADGWRSSPSSGGLVSALTPVLARSNGTWVGWPGVDAAPDDRPDLDELGGAEFDLVPVWLPEAERADFYEGFSNSVLWPLFHGFADRCDLDVRFYDAYQRANSRFATAALAAAPQNATLWVHDYHLIPGARLLRDDGYRGALGFFLHIPFPNWQIFARMPWRASLIDDLLQYDLVGFQTERDLDNFLGCAERFGGARVVSQRSAGVPIALETRGGRRLAVGAFPIGIDARSFRTLARTEATREARAVLDAKLGDRRLIIGVDRLDYSKGILNRLLAFEKLLERSPHLAQEVVFYQLVVPSREMVSEYASLKEEIERLVGRINGRFGSLDGGPLRYRYGSLDRPRLAALYAAAEIALVTPLCDGMNLVCKEYCAVKDGEPGALILSEAAGAAEALGDDALCVNPYDIEGLASTIERALVMPASEKSARMQRLSQKVHEHDVYSWASAFLTALDTMAPAKHLPAVRGRRRATTAIARA